MKDRTNDDSHSGETHAPLPDLSAPHDTTPPPPETHGPALSPESQVMDLRAQGASLIEMAEAFPAVTDENVHEANAFRLRASAAADKVDALFRPRISQADALHKGLIADWRAVRALPERALAAVDGKIGPYLREKRRLKEDAERQAAQARIDAENKRKADEQRILDEAKVLEDAGQADAAEKKLRSGILEMKKEAALPKAIPPPAPFAPSTPGTTLRRTKHWRISNFATLPSIYKKLVSDDEKIDRVMRATEGDPHIPGIEVYWEEKPVKARF